MASLRPNIFWKVGSNAAAVIDVKYKSGKSLGTRSLTPSSSSTVGIGILGHAIDLGRPPEQLIRQLSSLAEPITAMAATPYRYPI